METLVKNINGANIKFSEKEDGSYLPCTEDIFQAVGLSNTSFRSDMVFDLIFSGEFKKLFRAIAFCEDISIKQSRKRIIRLLIWQVGCRNYFEKYENRIIDNFNDWGGQISGFADMNLTGIINLLAIEGFDVKNIKVSSWDSKIPSF